VSAASAGSHAVGRRRQADDTGDRRQAAMGFELEHADLVGAGAEHVQVAAAVAEGRTPDSRSLGRRAEPTLCRCPGAARPRSFELRFIGRGLAALPALE